MAYQQTGWYGALGSATFTFTDFIATPAKSKPAKRRRKRRTSSRRKPRVS
jgi:hypothetical protein